MSATINQLPVFLATLYGGLIIGLLYGFFSLIRTVSHAGKIATVVLDIVFFLIATPLCMLVVYIANKADLRFYSFLGLLAGFCMYFFGLGYTIRQIAARKKSKAKED